MEYIVRQQVVQGLQKLPFFASIHSMSSSALRKDLPLSRLRLHPGHRLLDFLLRAETLDAADANGEGGGGTSPCSLQGCRPDLVGVPSGGRDDEPGDNPDDAATEAMAVAPSSANNSSIARSVNAWRHTLKDEVQIAKRF